MPWLISAGDGSERCVVCRLRQADKTYYVTWIAKGGPWPESVGWPVCSWEHAFQYSDRVEP